MQQRIGVWESYNPMTSRWHRDNIEPFWSRESITSLNFQLEKLSADQDLNKWTKLGYVAQPSRLTGLECDMKKKQPIWNSQLIDWFETTYKVRDTGINYFKMLTDTVLPVHIDTFTKYRTIFDCKQSDCVRVIVFPFDWESGHYFEIKNVAITNWSAGDYVMWQGEVPHMAANMGVTPRYSIQLTGHI